MKNLNNEFKDIQYESNFGIAYRYEDYYLYDNTYIPKLREFRVIKITPKGFKIKNPNFYGNSEKFVCNEGKKRFCYMSKEEALQGYIFRKKRAIFLIASSLKRQENFLKAAEKLI
jgi:hypothetical protein